jgi:sugar O-acyltransferase (sialic acid O-acetyltransferase NeuD family)
MDLKNCSFVMKNGRESMKKIKQLLLFPFGGNSKEALLSIFATNKIHKEWDVLGFVDDNIETWGMECCGIKVLGGRKIFDQYPEAKVLSVQGNPDTFRNRKNIIKSLNIERSRFAKIIHPSVTISPDAKIGYNTLFMANVVISCGVEIGNHCFSLPNTVFSHDAIIGNYCTFGSNITVSGYVNIKSNCYVGSGSRLKNHITIEENVLIGLGSNVISNIPQNWIIAGNPARRLKIDSQSNFQ